MLPKKRRTLDEIDKESKKKDKDSLIDEVQIALFKEVDIFDRRETFIAVFRVNIIYLIYSLITWFV